MKSKKNLFNIQLAMQEAILQRQLPKELVDCIAEKPPISTQRRVEIYQDAYQIRMVESLREDFPTVEDELKENFEAVALEFLDSHPSRYYNLCEVSQDFPPFLASKSKLLSNLAMTDWLKTLSGFAPEPDLKSIVSAEAIQNGEEFLLKIHPATVARRNGDDHHLAYRYLGESYVNTISKQQWKLIQFLTAARSLEDFTVMALELKFSDSELSALLSEWIKKEIIFCERKIK